MGTRKFIHCLIEPTEPHSIECNALVRRITGLIEYTNIPDSSKTDFLSFDGFRMIAVTSLVIKIILIRPQNALVECRMCFQSDTASH